MNPARTVLALSALPLAVAAGEDPSLTFVPPFPASNEHVVLFIDSPSGCVRANYTLGSADLAARTIVVSVTSADSGPVSCPPEHIAPRTMSLGAFPRGTYEVSFVACQFVPPGIEECGVVETRTLIVSGGSVAVPSLDAVAGGLLGLFVFLGGWLARVGGSGATKSKPLTNR